MKICKVCLVNKEDDQFPVRSKRCFECKKIAIKEQALKCYHKNKHMYPHPLKGIDEKSRKQRRDSYHKNKHNRTYFEIIVNKIFTSVKYRAKRLKRDFDLTREFLENLYTEQNGKCALTGMIFSDEKYENYKRRPFTPSLDRIDNKKGYTQDNVRFVCSMVNAALGEFGDKIFDKMCRSYIENTLLRRE
jgi:hypothetical protein